MSLGMNRDSEVNQSRSTVFAQSQNSAREEMKSSLIPSNLKKRMNEMIDFGKTQISMLKEGERLSAIDTEPDAEMSEHLSEDSKESDSKNKGDYQSTNENSQHDIMTIKILNMQKDRRKLQEVQSRLIRQIPKI